MPIFESDVNSLCTINFIDTEGQIPMVSSREVAAKFGKRHADVLRAIEEIKSHTVSEQFIERNFALNEYVDSIGRTLPEINLTKDGFSLVAMGFTGDEALAWKIRFLEAFNKLGDYAVELRAELERKELLIQSLQKQLGRAPKKNKFYIQVAVPVATLPGFPQKFDKQMRPIEDIDEPQKTLGQIIHLNKVIEGAIAKRAELMASLGLS